MMKKTGRFSIPHLENELKKGRQLQQDIIKETMCMPSFTEKDFSLKNTCLTDSYDFEIIDEKSYYDEWGIKYRNGSTLIRAKFSPKRIDEHFHEYLEDIKIIKGNAKFNMNDVEIKLTAGSKLTIKPMAMHSCEFIDETEAIICIPSKLLGQIS